jgi:hypothetical protein
MDLLDIEIDISTSQNFDILTELQELETLPALSPPCSQHDFEHKCTTDETEFNKLLTFHTQLQQSYERDSVLRQRQMLKNLNAQYKLINTPVFRHTFRVLDIIDPDQLFRESFSFVGNACRLMRLPCIEENWCKLPCTFFISSMPCSVLHLHVVNANAIGADGCKDVLQKTVELLIPDSKGHFDDYCNPARFGFSNSTLTLVFPHYKQRLYLVPESKRVTASSHNSQEIKIPVHNGFWFVPSIDLPDCNCGIKTVLDLFFSLLPSLSYKLVQSDSDLDLEMSRRFDTHSSPTFYENKERFLLVNRIYSFLLHCFNCICASCDYYGYVDDEFPSILYDTPNDIPYFLKFFKLNDLDLDGMYATRVMNFITFMFFYLKKCVAAVFDDSADESHLKFLTDAIVLIFAVKFVGHFTYFVFTAFPDIACHPVCRCLESVPYHNRLLNPVGAPIVEHLFFLASKCILDKEMLSQYINNSSSFKFYYSGASSVLYVNLDV